MTNVQLTPEAEKAVLLKRIEALEARLPKQPTLEERVEQLEASLNRAWHQLGQFSDAHNRHMDAHR